MRCALSIAGSDSIGGAGIQADVKAMAAVGIHAHTVITALTAQNTCSVKRIMPVPTDMIEDQLEAVLSDSDVKAVKTGMLYSAEIVEVVVDAFEDHSIPIVVDPVLVAGVGDSLATDDLAKAVKRKLMPICDLITPNRYEAEILSGMRINNEDDARMACEIMGKEGSTIYLKGGHMDSGTVVDTLYNGAEFKRFEYPRLETAGHGGGCTLSAYITAHLAKGMDVINSIIRSREMIQDSIANMYAIGKCDKVVSPLFNLNDKIQQQSDPDRLRVISSLNSAADRLVRIIPEDWVPKKGVNIVYAANGATGPQDVAGLQGNITIFNRRVKKNGSAKFGASDNTAKMVLTAMKYDPEQRAAVNLMCSVDLASIMEEVGMTGVLVKGKGNDVINAASQAIKKNGSVPDVAMMFNGGNDAHITIFGKDPDDLLKKIDSII